MPRLCGIVDETLKPDLRLDRQYVTTIEVGGAYAHLFYPLLDFLELKTLIITDIDATKAIKAPNKKGHVVTRHVKCPLSEGEQTSNKAVKVWFEEVPEQGKAKDPKSVVKPVSLEELKAKTSHEKDQGIAPPCLSDSRTCRDGVLCSEF